MGLFKVSLHPCDTVAAFTKQSGVVFDSGSRVHRAWPRPTEFHPGSPRGPVVHVPHTPLGPRSLLGERWDKEIKWLDAPSVGQVVSFAIVLEVPGGAANGRILLEGDEVIGSVTDKRAGTTA